MYKMCDKTKFNLIKKNSIKIVFIIQWNYSDLLLDLLLLLWFELVGKLSSSGSSSFNASPCSSFSIS